MKIIIASDSFKNCLPADAVARHLADGFRSVLPEAEIELLPLADGGEGSLAALERATGGLRRELSVTGPRGEAVTAALLRIGSTSVIEMAQAAGLELLTPDRCDPLRTTTYGVGELMADELRQGRRDFLITLGGSATCDGGAGMLQALGMTAEPANGFLTGGDLGNLRALDPGTLYPTLRESRIRVACDVTNPLTGPDGAAAVFAPQKGASPEAVQLLEAGMRHYLARLRVAGIDTAEQPGDGAAGGMGFALRAVLGGRLQSGAELMLELAGFAERLPGADWVITGEGRSDHQTVQGKLCAVVARTAHRHAVPVVLASGAIADEAALSDLFDRLERVSDPALPLAENLRRAPEMLHRTGAQIARCLRKIR